MKHPKLRKELLLAVIFSLILVLMRVFHYHLDRFFQEVRVDIITLAALLIVVILLAVQVYKIWSRRKKSKGKIKLRFVFYLPAIVLLSSILYSFSPLLFNSEKLESKVVLRGCYEAGSSHAYIIFRQNKDFEIKWTNESGNIEWYFGMYKNAKDTLYLAYYDKSPDKFGSIILNTGQTLTSLDKSLIVGNYFVSFYLGNCKGNNTN